MQASTVESLPTRRLRPTYWVLALLFLVSQAEILHSVSSKITDEDQTLLWFAGHELAHLRLHTPNFYGQTYNTVFEALPGQLLTMMGMPLSLASPLGTTAIATLCWAVLAWASYRQRQYLSAALALCLPFLLSTEYLILFDAPRGVLAGDLLSALTVVTAITLRKPHARLGVVTALGGLACLWDQATVVVVLPVLAVAFIAALRSPQKRWSRSMAALLGGGSLPVAWWSFQKWFYHSHPYDNIWPTVDASFSIETLVRNVKDPGRPFDFYSLRILPSSYASLAIAVLLIGAAILVGGRRRYEPAVVSLVTLACVLIILSVPKTLDAHPGIYLSGSRFFLPLPLALWSIAYYTIEAWKSKDQELVDSKASKERIIVVGVTFLSLASFALSQFSFGADVAKDLEISLKPEAIVHLTDPKVLLATCNRLKDDYIALGAEVLVTPDPNVAYGCATLDMDTIRQDYERRGWVLEDATTRVVTRILVFGWQCKAFDASVGTCVPQKSGAQLLTTAPRSIAATMRAAGLPIRGT